MFINFNLMNIRSCKFIVGESPSRNLLCQRISSFGVSEKKQKRNTQKVSKSIVESLVGYAFIFSVKYARQAYISKVEGIIYWACCDALPVIFQSWLFSPENGGFCGNPSHKKHRIVHANLDHCHTCWCLELSWFWQIKRRFSTRGLFHWHGLT